MAYRSATALALMIAVAACTRGVDDGATSGNDALSMGDLPVTIADTSVSAGVFQQVIDHTAGTTVTGTFNQRFWYSTEFATGPSSPVLLHICGEYECDQTYLQRLADTAKTLHASVVTLEHRYYGTSLPFGDRPTADQYQYLTIGQALDDIASFATFAKANLPLSGGWIVAGGSYAGMLAAFVRLKHPEVIAGAWASSAPVNMQQSFYGYDAVSSLSLGKDCGDLLRLALTEVTPTLSDPTAGPAMINKLFSDPDSLQWFNSQPVAQQASVVSSMFSGVAMNFAQVNTGGPQLCSALAQYASHPIDGMIGYFAPPLVAGDDDDDAGTSNAAPPATAAATGLSALGPGGAQVAASLTVTGMRASTTANGTGNGTANDADAGAPPPLPPEWVADMSWDWQACTEMGFIQISNPDTANSIMQRSGPNDVANEVARCLRNTGKPMNVDATRAAYFDPIVNGQASNILFVNGTFDPWSSLSFTDPAHAPPGTQVYVIAQGHHHEELESLTPTSLLGEFEAHKLLHDLAVQWLAAPAPATPDAGR